MDATTAKEWMRVFNQKIQAHKEYLSELDTPIGDGDHGSNMARGMEAVVGELENKSPETTSDVFKIVAMQLLSKVGGASGPLYGSAFMGMSKSFSQGDDVKESLKAALSAIQHRGKAEVGEKTMVDVWTPVLDELEHGSLTNEKIDDIVGATQELQATKGRASYVGERSIGHIDPGSYSSGLLFKSLLEVGGV